MPISYTRVYSSLSFEDRIEFRDLTIAVMRELYPHYIIRSIEPANTDQVFLTNHQDNVRMKFPLGDLYAHFQPTARTKTDLKNTLLRVYAHMLKIVEDAEEVGDDSKLTWTEVRDLVRPRLVRNEELHNSDAFVSTPFGSELSTVIVIDDLPVKGLISMVKREMLTRWELTEKDLLDKALVNLVEISDGMEFVGTAPPRGYLWNERNEDFSATTILLGGVRGLVAETIGSPFRFALPSRYIMYCWAALDDSAFQTEMRAMMEREFDRLPSKLTPIIFEVGRDGNINQMKNQPMMPVSPDVSNN